MCFISHEQAAANKVTTTVYFLPPTQAKLLLHSSFVAKLVLKVALVVLNRLVSTHRLLTVPCSGEIQEPSLQLEVFLCSLPTSLADFIVRVSPYREDSHKTQKARLNNGR